MRYGATGAESRPRGALPRWTLGWGFEPQITRLGGGCPFRARLPEHPRRGSEPPLMLRRAGSRTRPGCEFVPRRSLAAHSSSGAFSDVGSSSSVRVFAAGFAFVAVARFLGFLGAAVSPAGSSFRASAIASVPFGSAFGSALVSFFSYSSTKRIVLRSESSRRSATTRNFDTNHFSSVLHTSGRWTSALPPFRSILNWSARP